MDSLNFRSPSAFDLSDNSISDFQRRIGCGQGLGEACRALGGSLAGDWFSWEAHARMGGKPTRALGVDVLDSREEFHSSQTTRRASALSGHPSFVLSNL